MATTPSAQAELPPYEVDFTKCLMTGDDAPGIAGATVVFLFIPQIDGAGNVLLDGYIAGPGITFSNDRAIWYGQPGSLSVVIREGDPAPGIDGGFIAELWTTYVSETGVVCLSCYLEGPSIVSGVNARGNFAGPPGSLQKIVQAGDPAPLTEPGTVFASSSNFALRLSDNGVTLALYDLAGPAVDSSNDQVMYTGFPDNPQIVWRRGMAAPDTEPGVVILYADNIQGPTINDLGQSAFRGVLAGETINPENDVSNWLGDASGLTLISREGDAVPGFIKGVTYSATGGIPTLNALGDVGFTALIEGPGVTVDDNRTAWIYEHSGQYTMLVREGYPVVGAPTGAVLDHVERPLVSASGVALAGGRLRGSPISPSASGTALFGTAEAFGVDLRDGDPLGPTDPGALLSSLVGSSSRGALNDVGDVALVVPLTGDAVDASNDRVVLFRSHAYGQWIRLFREGDLIDGKIVGPDGIDTGGFGNKTTGSDGFLQSFADSRTLVTSIGFSDGSRGNYLVSVKLRGDFDADVDIDLEDVTTFQDCYMQDLSLAPSCAIFDFDADGTLGLIDWSWMAAALVGP